MSNFRWRGFSQNSKKFQEPLFKEQKRSRKKKISVATVTGSIIFGVTVFHVPILRQYGKWLSAESQNPVADVGVVMGAVPYRIKTAAGLLDSGAVNHIFINSVSKEKFETLISKHGIPEEQAYWGGCGATNTYSQPFYFAEFYEKHNLNDIEKIVIVTSPYHLRRASWSYQHVLKQQDIRIDIKTYPALSRRDRANLSWWQYAHGRRWVSYETQKNIFYRFYYGLLNKPSKDIDYNSFLDKEGSKPKQQRTEDYCK